MQEKFLDRINNNIPKRDSLLKDNLISKLMETTDQGSNSTDDVNRIYLNSYFYLLNYRYFI